MKNLLLFLLLIFFIGCQSGENIVAFRHQECEPFMFTEDWNFLKSEFYLASSRYKAFISKLQILEEKRTYHEHLFYYTYDIDDVQKTVIINMYDDHEKLIFVHRHEYRDDLLKKSEKEILKWKIVLLVQYDGSIPIRVERKMYYEGNFYYHIEYQFNPDRYKIIFEHKDYKEKSDYLFNYTHEFRWRATPIKKEDQDCF